jgi:hypothetical protein
MALDSGRVDGCSHSNLRIGSSVSKSKQETSIARLQNETLDHYGEEPLAKEYLQEKMNIELELYAQRFCDAHELLPNPQDFKTTIRIYLPGIKKKSQTKTLASASPLHPHWQKPLLRQRRHWSTVLTFDTLLNRLISTRYLWVS